MIDKLSSDLLLLVFKKLDSYQMAKVLRVNKEWFEIIDNHKSLWRRLILPKWNETPRSLPALRVFDKKSDSQLTEVSMNINYVAQEEVEEIVDLMERSKETLEVLDVESSNGNLKHKCNELAWKLPNLMFLKTTSSSRESHLVLHVTRDKDQDTIMTENSNDLPRLKLLWTSPSRTLLTGGIDRFKNLSSLHLNYKRDSLEWRSLLQGPSRTLKHFRMFLQETSDQGHQVQVEALQFPRLQVLEVYSYDSRFPSWMKIPTSCLLFDLSYRIPSSLPTISTLWISGLRGIEKLHSLVPEMRELRSVCFEQSSFNSQGQELISMLRQRKRNFEIELEVGGVKMIQLERLVFYFKYYTDEEISQLRELVAEVVDLKTVSEVIELEL